MTKLIIVALRALQKAADKSAARAEVGHSVLSADKSAAESLSTAIKSITEA